MEERYRLTPKGVIVANLMKYDIDYDYVAEKILDSFSRQGYVIVDVDYTRREDKDSK